MLRQIKTITSKQTVLYPVRSLRGSFSSVCLISANDEHNSDEQGTASNGEVWL